MKNVLALVLGGGRGTRLYPLTKYRSKPAVPLAGKYRLIDVPISNCINSGVNMIYVLTQFNSVSLHRHIRRTYTFDSYSNGFVEILAAQQTLGSSDWYQGTADAVRQNIRYLQGPDISHVLILSGDQLYRMNYAEMLATHKESQADVTIAAMPVTREAASGFGIMRGDDTGRVVGFLEKPKTAEQADIACAPSRPGSTPAAWQAAAAISLASMGIYLFNRDLLVDLLTKTDYHDFGREIFPAAISIARCRCIYSTATGKTSARSNRSTSATLIWPPPIRRSNWCRPRRRSTRGRDSCRRRESKVRTIRQSLISDGCLIGEGAVIENSVIGLRCRIGRGVTIRNSVVMGADDYDSPATMARSQQTIPQGIGEGSEIDGVIVDKNCRIGATSASSTIKDSTAARKRRST